MIAQGLLLFVCILAAYYIGKQEVHSYYINKAKFKRQRRKDIKEGYALDFDNYLDSL